MALVCNASGYDTGPLSSFCLGQHPKPEEKDHEQQVQKHCNLINVTICTINGENGSQCEKRWMVYIRKVRISLLQLIVRKILNVNQFNMHVNEI